MLFLTPLSCSLYQLGLTERLFLVVSPTVFVVAVVCCLGIVLCLLQTINEQLTTELEEQTLDLERKEKLVKLQIFQVKKLKRNLKDLVTSAKPIAIPNDHPILPTPPHHTHHSPRKERRPMPYVQSVSVLLGLVWVYCLGVLFGCTVLCTIFGCTVWVYCVVYCWGVLFWVYCFGDCVGVCIGVLFGCTGLGVLFW